MSVKSCFFIGHREADVQLIPQLVEIIERLITEEQVSLFYVGGYGGFDRIAGNAVKRVKKQYPNIALMLVLPYHPAERPTEVPPGYDGTYHPDGLENVPRKYVIVRANRIMVAQSDWIVAYVRHGVSNSKKLLEYAQRFERKGIVQIINLAEDSLNQEKSSNT